MPCMSGIPCVTGRESRVHVGNPVCMSGKIPCTTGTPPPDESRVCVRAGNQHCTGVHSHPDIIFIAWRRIHSRPIRAYRSEWHPGSRGFFHRLLTRAVLLVLEGHPMGPRGSRYSIRRDWMAGDTLCGWHPVLCAWVDTVVSFCHHDLGSWSRDWCEEGGSCR